MLREDEVGGADDEGLVLCVSRCTHVPHSTQRLISVGDNPMTTPFMENERGRNSL